MKNPHYWPQLDGVRGIAILAVLLLHGSYGYFRGGFLGVDLFFSLSGFLITSLLFQEWNRSQTISLRRFYLRRLLRLYPALMATVVFAFFVWPHPLEPPYWRAAFAALFYHMNFVTMDRNPLAHTWSLSIEEQFYLFWPPLLMVLLPLRKPIRFALILTALFASIAVRLTMLNAGESSEAIYKFTFARTDSLLCGCVAALWISGIAKNRSDDHKRFHLTPNVISSVCLLALCFLFLRADKTDLWLMTWGYTAVAFLCAGFVTSAALLNLEEKSLVSMFLHAPMMRYLGTRSYGLYLYHFLIFEQLERLRTHHSLVNFLLVTVVRFAATVLVAELSFRFIEKPFLNLKQRFEPENGTALNPLREVVQSRSV